MFPAPALSFAPLLQPGVTVLSFTTSEMHANVFPPGVTLHMVQYWEQLKVFSRFPATKGNTATHVKFFYSGVHIFALETDSFMGWRENWTFFTLLILKSFRLTHLLKMLPEASTWGPPFRHFRKMSRFMFRSNRTPNHYLHVWKLTDLRLGKLTNKEQWLLIFGWRKFMRLAFHISGSAAIIYHSAMICNRRLCSNLSLQIKSLLWLALGAPKRTHTLRYMYNKEARCALHERPFLGRGGGNTNQTCMAVITPVFGWHAVVI